MERRILIADDEQLIREGIKARLEYLDLMPAELYEAESGEQAMSILNEHEVEIVITDIRMAKMSGLTFIRQAKSLYPDLQFIILSGYAEFEYAEQAIQLGVKAYLLKPISNDSLKKAIQEADAKLEELESLKSIVIEKKRSMAEKKRLLFDKNVNDLLRSNSHLLQAECQREVYREFQAEGTWVMLGIIHIDVESYEQGNFAYRDIELVKFSIRNVYHELESKCKKVIVNNLANRNQLYALLAHKNKENLRLEAEKLFTTLSNHMGRKLKISLTFGISSAVAHLSADCSKEASEALLQRIIHGKGNLYFYDDIRILSADQFPTSELHMLHQYIERRDAGNIEFLIHNIFSDENVKKYNTVYIRIIWARIMNILLNVVNSAFPDNFKNVEKLVLNFDLLDTFQSMDELRGYLYTLMLDYIQINGDGDVNARNKIRMGIKYIKENYNKDIAINELAEKYAISPNYFSTTFKKETGQTTVNFIKELRMKKACEYLVNSEKSVVDIAKEVGYEDSQYFFRVFKKATGLTPLEYRRTRRK